ncbi:hypothetical protein COLO4_37974 [Corchorus olitorius]|uniref:Uncharacterized protein n=1 Tax=Corchorus olitorius TaxID=93759 RepID=A0A1R3FXR4_9ROSI|nr:hypothetical protein COLO4_37974 [Corchorus olitorius]
MSKFPNAAILLRKHFPRLPWKRDFRSYIFSDPNIGKVYEKVYDIKPDELGVKGDQHYADDVYDFVRYIRNLYIHVYKHLDLQAKEDFCRNFADNFKSVPLFSGFLRVFLSTFYCNNQFKELFEALFK